MPGRTERGRAAWAPGDAAQGSSQPAPPAACVARACPWAPRLLWALRSPLRRTVTTPPPSSPPPGLHCCGASHVPGISLPDRVLQAASAPPLLRLGWCWAVSLSLSCALCWFFSLHFPLRPSPSGRKSLQFCEALSALVCVCLLRSHIYPVRRQTESTWSRCGRSPGIHPEGPLPAGGPPGDRDTSRGGVPRLGVALSDMVAWGALRGGTELPTFFRL